ncbi:MAG: hypothetical protein LBJ04_17210 [Sphingobacterium sp.]|jgi:uncharacterized protein (DUF1501 family)|nr:hypothetical protein [Sphingobacterium sp.]
MKNLQCGKLQRLAIVESLDMGLKEMTSPDALEGNGTDYGTANQLLFISDSLKQQGLLKDLPDLNQLNEGDFGCTKDFRKVYATLLKKWFGAIRYRAGKLNL